MEFGRDTRGDAVTWTVLIIIGVVIAVIVFTHVKGNPGNLGDAITNAGSNAATGLNSVTVQ
jgi:hypothetical protein